MAGYLEPSIDRSSGGLSSCGNNPRCGADCRTFWSEEANVGFLQIPSRLGQPFRCSAENNLKYASVMRRRQRLPGSGGYNGEVLENRVYVRLLGSLPVHVLGAESHARPPL